MTTIINNGILRAKTKTMTDADVDFDLDNICESNNALTTETGIAGSGFGYGDLDRAKEGPSRVNIENHQIVDINPQWAYLVLV